MLLVEAVMVVRERDGGSRAAGAAWVLRWRWARRRSREMGGSMMMNNSCLREMFQTSEMGRTLGRFPARTGCVNFGVRGVGEMERRHAISGEG